MADMEIVLVVTFFELVIGWLQLQQRNLFETHPKTMNVAVNSLVLCWFMYGFKLRFPTIYETYLGVVPIGVDFFGSLSLTSALSFLLRDSVRPFVYFLGLLIPSINIFTRILQKLEATFSQTEFWKRYVDPVVFEVIRMVNRGRLMRPILPR